MGASLMLAIPTTELSPSPADIDHCDVRLRYLADSFALRALRRRKVIAQFLGSSRAEHRRRMISWVGGPARQGRLRGHAPCRGGEHFAGLWEFPPADPHAHPRVLLAGVPKRRVGAGTAQG